MIVQLYNFAKKHNSTAQPAGTGDSFDCRLKDQTSVTDPVILLDLNDKVNFTKYTYAYIPEFSRYYFVSDMVADGLCWSVYLTCDVLATYKTDIGNSTMYVLRSAAAYDGRIIDNFYPMMPTYSDNHQHSDLYDYYTSELNHGCFVLGIIGAENDGNNVGSVRYYVMQEGPLYRLTNGLLNLLIDNPTDFDFSEIPEGLQKCIVDPLQFIKSCIWLPYPITSVAQTGTLRINLSVNGWTVGDAQTPINNYMADVTPPYVETTNSFTLLKHPWASTRGSYLNTSPYTKITLTVAPFGSFDLDTSILNQAVTLTVNVKTDIISGTGVLEVRADNNILIRTTSQVGTTIQLAQGINNIVGGLAGFGGGIMSAIGSSIIGNVFGSVGGIASTIGSAVDTIKPTVSTIGGNGGFVDLSGGINIDYVFYYPVDDDPDHAGRPLCENRQLSTLSGYQLLMDGDVTISGTAGEQASIKSFLEGGYYYE